MRTARMRVPALLLAGVLLLSACAGEEQVGSEELLDFEEQTEGPRLGERPTPSEEVPAGTAKPPKRRRDRKPQQPAPAEQAPPQAEPEQQPADPPPKQEEGPTVALTIKITGDQSGTSQFDPSAAAIFEGTCAEWKNTDTVPRSVEADDETFASGPIKPGRAWTWCPKAPGKFNYHDGTRPYAVASIEVVKR